MLRARPSKIFQEKVEMITGKYQHQRVSHETKAYASRLGILIMERN